MRANTDRRRQLEDEHGRRRGARPASRRSRLRRLDAIDGVEKMLCPPFVYLPLVAELARGTTLQRRRAGHALGGEGRLHRRGQRRDAARLRDARDHRPLGAPRSTSARRTRRVNRKLRAALAHGLTPIVCVGETGEQRNAGQTQRRAAPPGARRARRHNVAATARSSPTSRSGRSAPASPPRRRTPTTRSASSAARSRRCRATRPPQRGAHPLRRQRHAREHRRAGRAAGGRWRPRRRRVAGRRLLRAMAMRSRAPTVSQDTLKRDRRSAQTPFVLSLSKDANLDDATAPAPHRRRRRHGDRQDGRCRSRWPRRSTAKSSPPTPTRSTAASISAPPRSSPSSARACRTT